MKYKQCGNMAYNLHLIKTDKFKKNIIRVNFRKEYNKQDITYRNLLRAVLTSTTKNYKTERELAIRREELYGTYCSIGRSLLAKEEVTIFDLVYFNDDVTEKGNSKKSILLLMEMLFNPNIDGNKFDQKQFDRCKKQLEEIIIQAEESTDFTANKRFHEIMFDGTPLAIFGPGYLEDLKEITSESLYEYYLNMIKSDLVDIFVCGDFNEEEIKKIFNDSFKISTIKRKRKDIIIKQDKFRRKPQFVLDKKDVKQSDLYIGAKILPMDRFELIYISKLFSYILGGSSGSKLFKTLREEKSLCYSTYSSITPNCGYMTIYAGLSYKDSKDAIKTIKKLIKDISKGKFDKEIIEEFITVCKAARKEIEDNPMSMISYEQAREYYYIDDYDTMVENLLKIKVEDVIKFSKKIKLDTIYIQGGEE